MNPTGKRSAGRFEVKTKNGDVLEVEKWVTYALPGAPFSPDSGVSEFRIVRSNHLITPIIGSAETEFRCALGGEYTRVPLLTRK